MGSSFELNSASEYGAAIAAGDGSALNVSQSTFTWNGVARGRRLPPLVSVAGGLSQAGGSGCAAGRGPLPIAGWEEVAAHLLWPDGGRRCLRASA